MTLHFLNDVANGAESKIDQSEHVGYTVLFFKTYIKYILD